MLLLFKIFVSIENVLDVKYTYIEKTYISFMLLYI